MAYITSNDYKNIIYSGEAQHTCYLKFNNTVVTNADYYIEKITIKSNIFDTTSQVFSLNNFISKEVTIVMHDYNGTIEGPVDLKIGTLVNGSYEYVPIGIFNIQDKPVNDKNTITIKLRDNAVLFDKSYDASSLIENNGGTVTMLALLQDICTTFGVTLATNTFVNSDTLTGAYDSTLTGRQHIAYICEKAGCIATIGRNGQLYLISLNNSLTKDVVDPDIVESFDCGTTFTVSRTKYEDGKRDYEYGTTTNDTVYITASNPYILVTENVENIHNSINGLTFNSFQTGKIIGNPAIDPYDFLSITYNNVEYITFAQNELVYNGVMIQTFDTNISEGKKEENTTIVSSDAKYSRIYTEIDEQNTKISTVVERTDTVEELSEQVNGENGIASQINDVKLLIAQTERTILEQTSENFTMWFQQTGLQQQLDDVQAIAESEQTKSETLEQYIRFSSNGIEIGKSDSQVKLLIQNDIIKFMTGDNMSAYISNNALYITDSTILNKQQIGHWLTQEDANHNLNTKWVNS